MFIIKKIDLQSDKVHTITLPSSPLIVQGFGLDANHRRTLYRSKGYQTILDLGSIILVIQAK
jgi:hypothetical protein